MTGEERKPKKRPLRYCISRMQGGDEGNPIQSLRLSAKWREGTEEDRK